MNYQKETLSNFISRTCSNEKPLNELYSVRRPITVYIYLVAIDCCLLINQSNIQ